MVNLYVNRNSIEEITKILGISRWAISKYLHKENIKIRKSKHVYNENFFDNIDSEPKAYILGMLYSDGCNDYKRGVISLFLKKDDEKIVEKMSSFLYSKRKLYYYRRGTCDVCGFQLTNRKLSNRLNELGCVQKKSLIIEFPPFLEDNMVRHFVRGVFDGDGCIHLAKNKKQLICSVSICSGSKEFLPELNKRVENVLGLSGRFHKHKKTGVYNYAVRGNIRCRKFLDWMYDDAELFMQRKYDTYLKQKEIKLGGPKLKEKQVKKMVNRYKNGETVTSLAKEFKIKRDTVMRYLKKENVYYIKNNRLSEADKKILLKKYNNGENKKEIIDKFNISPMTFYRITKLSFQKAA